MHSQTDIEKILDSRGRLFSLAGRNVTRYNDWKWESDKFVIEIR